MNNIKALIFHILIVMLSFIFLIIFVSTAPKLGKFTTHIVSRLFFSFILISSYVF